MINRIVIVGRITKDPELKKTKSGLSTVSFTLAVNRNIKKEGQVDADFINCVAWRSSADFMANYVRKGSLLGIEGRIQTRNYDDTNGKKVYVTEVVCDSVQNLERKRDATQTAANEDYNHYQRGATEVTYDGSNVTIDDLPF